MVVEVYLHNQWIGLYEFVGLERVWNLNYHTMNEKYEISTFTSAPSIDITFHRCLFRNQFSSLSPLPVVTVMLIWIQIQEKSMHINVCVYKITYHDTLSLASMRDAYPNTTWTCIAICIAYFYHSALFSFKSPLPAIFNFDLFFFSPKISSNGSISTKSPSRHHLQLPTSGLWVQKQQRSLVPKVFPGWANPGTPDTKEDAPSAMRPS